MKPFFVCTVLIVLSFQTNIQAQGNPAPTKNPSKRLVALGDSLTEGYGVAKEEAYPSLLEKKIKESGKDWIVVNAGVAGSTSASGPSRIKWLMKSKIDLLLLALGANDGLRGIKIRATEKNLAETIEIAQKNGITVVLAGMLIPPNYGKDYTKKFQQIFVSLSKKYKIKLIPFLLDKVGGEVQLNQTDGIHPNTKGHEIVSENVYLQIKDIL
jgi:acyl-CoA thioesterase I